MGVKNEIGVGIFFFIAMVILGYFTIIMSGDFFKFHDYYSMTVVFTNIEGLGLSDKVKVNGVLSGNVEDIQLRENMVAVRLKMYNRFTLYENYKIKIRNETTLGGRYVAIYPGTKTYEGHKLAIITTREDLRGEVVEDIFGTISDFIAENRSDVNAAIKQFKTVFEKINRGEGTIGKLINEDKFHNDSDELIKELRDTIEDVREQAPVTSFIRAALLAF
jgi:phospholipid/cholesterol/gamma-HCH transport system substrate-binding protein